MTIPSSFPEILDIHIPVRWEDLDDKQLASVLKVLAVVPEQRAASLVMLAMAGITVDRKVGDSYVCRYGSTYFRLSVEDVAGWLHFVNFLGQIPDTPVRLKRIGKAKAVDDRLHGVPLENWLTLENYYQAYLRAKDFRAVDAMAPILYPGQTGKVQPFQRIGILLWMAAIKQLFARLFPELYAPANGGQDGEDIDMTQVVNAQIRALTGGDITKERQVLETDCWRALTELNEKAREYRELKKR